MRYAALLLAFALLPAAPDAREPFRVLVYSATAGFRHESIPDGIAAIERLGAEHGFDVDVTEDAAAFTGERLARYEVVLFLSTTGDILPPAGERALEERLRAGGGWVGVHAAADTEYEWPWYGRLVGAYFHSHPPVGEATMCVLDRAHPSTQGLPERWTRTDEWYAWRESPRGKVHVLATVEVRGPDGAAVMDDHPIAWCHEYGGGRAWYTALGHTKESFTEPLFLDHLLGGIRWAAGRAEGKASATLDRCWDKVVLDDRVTDPMELAVAPDGRVVFVERGGAIKVWRPDSLDTVTAGFLDVFDELEDGLLGVALDPRFTENGWIYVYYSPAGAEPKNVLSRLVLDGDVVAPESEVVMLDVATQRDECCHSGGSLAFDARGRLYLSTGDNTSPFASDGYAPIDERPGRSAFDAQKSSANTFDLRGKILRIEPKADGSYAIPEGNLFAPDGILGRPETYAMGCRNPFRISIDAATGHLYWGDVGPDASDPSDARGPAGHDEINRASGPGNFGWPYFIGANLPYRDFDFAAAASGAPFDAAHPVNDSANNTGRRELPPAQPAWISYPYGASGAFPLFASGGRCAMAGPVYRFDGARASPRALPAYYDSMLFIYDWAREWILAVRFDEAGEILAIHPFAQSIDLVRPHDMEIGPDGCLYLIEWGRGFGGGNRDSRLVRFEHHASGKRPPVVRASAQPSSGAAPLTVRFSADGSASRDESPALSFAWDFDGDGAVDAREADVTHVYEIAGNHAVRLTVTDASGQSATATAAVSAGNTRPEVELVAPKGGGVCDPGEPFEYRLRVRDAEDAAIDDDRVIVQVSLGHDTHAHPLRTWRGLEGLARTGLDETHGADADLFTVVQAHYTDDGAPGVSPLTGRAEVILQPRRKRAEYATTSGGIRLEKGEGSTDERSTTGRVATFDAPGAWISIRPLSLEGIDGVTLRSAARGPGAALVLRLDSVNGPVLGRTDLGETVVALEAGAHPFRVEFFERTGVAGLRLEVSGPDLASVRQVFGGATVEYYALDESAERLPDFARLEPYAVASAQSIDVAETGGAFAGSGRADDVGAVFRGTFEAREGGRYTFFLTSDDGARFWIGDECVIDNDGLHAMTERSSDERWRSHEIAVTDPGGAHELFIVCEAASPAALGEPATVLPPVMLEWIEFRGRGVSAEGGRTEH